MTARFHGCISSALCAGLLLVCAVLAGLSPVSSDAADTPAEFGNPALEKRYRTLIDELRCLVCQNQTLADSHADLAQDLRDEVMRQLESGKSDEEIKNFLVERYGDFVLYRPPLKFDTWLLWLGPFLLLLFALSVISRRRRSSPGNPEPLSAGERDRIQSLLPGPDEPPRS